MAAVLLTGHGGLEEPDRRTDVAVPRPAPGEVLIRVAAARSGSWSPARPAVSGSPRSSSRGGAVPALDVLGDPVRTWTD